MSYDHDDDSGMMRIPSPNLSGGYASGSAAGPSPAGMVFVPSLNTYVDDDVAAQLGLSGPSGSPGYTEQPTALNPFGLRPGHDPYEDVQDEEMTDEELAAAQDEMDEAYRDASLSPIVDELAEVLAPDDFDAGVESLVAGDLDSALDRITETTGLDADAATMLIETAIEDVSPFAHEMIGEAAWGALVYAASATNDEFARRIVSDIVTGATDMSRLSNAYRLWYQSLPDA